MIPDLIDENYRWISFLISFIISSVCFSNTLLINFIMSFLIYCLCGGWRFMRILVLTGPRDLGGLKVLLSVKLKIWQMKRKGHTIPDLFEHTAEIYRSKPAFMFGEDIFTFSEIDDFSNKMANYLYKLGVIPGNVVGLFMESRPGYVATWLGISKIGAVPALINTNLRNKTLIHCINDANIVGIICGVELAGAFNEVSGEVVNPRIFKLFLEANLTSRRPVNGTSRPCVTDPAMDYLLDNESTARPANIRHSTRKVTDPLMYIYTSGTTGLPKAAKVSHARFVMMSYGAGQMFRIRPSDIVYNTLPLYHTAGGMIGMGLVIINGCTMALRKKFSASNFWADCIKYDATIAQYIGEICRYLLAQPERPEERNHRVRLVFGNGIRPQIWSEFQTRFNVAQIGEFYGATESNANIVNSVNKVGAVGFGTRILPSLYPIMLIKIDPDTNEPIRDNKGLCIQCKAGEVGEMVGKIDDSDPLKRFDGYVNKSATNKKIVYDVFRRGDRAFLTGDLLIQDDLGFFFFRDRLGDTFRWKGENVSTAEVEAILSNCLHLNDCVVYGVEIPNHEGRAGMAAIVDTEKKIDNFSKLIVKLQTALPAYARPVFIRLCHNIEITGTFKLKKVDLIKNGFDPSIISDAVFFYDSKCNDYLRLGPESYDRIMMGGVRF